jgi:uncharacterized protein YlxW (UPF0749 family)
MILEKRSPRHPLHEALGDLPVIEPRPGLKEEMLRRILSEVRQKEEEVRKPKRFFGMQALRHAISFGSVAVVTVLAVALFPGLKQNFIDVDSSSSSVSQSPRTIQDAEDEIAYKKAHRQHKLFRQVIPQNNGQFIGEGVEITIHDENSALIRKEVLANDLESNVDIYRLVQELYAHGGQLVAINGIQVGAYTKVVLRGTLMEIQNRRVLAPFTIKVIGDGEKLFHKLQDPNSALMQLKQADNLHVTLEKRQLVAIAEE